MVATSTQVLLAILAASRTVYGHGAIIDATGDQGGSGMGMGVDPSTPRDGTGRNPFQQDSTRFQGDAAESFGETLGGGDNSAEAGTQGIMDITGDQLPQVSQGGQLTMTVHQVNSDGAGPYTCMINSDGTGASWTPIDVSTNLAGNERGRNRDGEASDFPLVAEIPANQQCTGTVAGQDNLCMVRCENPARAGPFGGVVPVQMAGAAQAAPAAGAANNANAAATNSTAPATANAGAAAAGRNNNNNANAKRQTSANDQGCDDEIEAALDEAAGVKGPVIVAKRASEVAAESWAKMKLKRSRVGGFSL